MTKTQELTAADRCDRCGAEAVITFQMKTAGDPADDVWTSHPEEQGEHPQAAVVWDAGGEVSSPVEAPPQFDKHCERMICFHHRTVTGNLTELETCQVCQTT